MRCYSDFKNVFIKETYIIENEKVNADGITSKKQKNSNIGKDWNLE